MCIEAANSHGKQFPEMINVAKHESSFLSWCIPVFKSLSLIIDGRASVQHPSLHDRNIPDNFTAEACFMFLSYLLRFCMVLPVGKELLACLSAFKEMGSCTEGQDALLSIFMHIRSSTTEEGESQIKHDSDATDNMINASEWMEHPPLLCCWRTLLRSISSKDVPAVHIATAIETLSLGTLNFCMDGESLNLERLAAIKFFFGVKNENAIEGFIEESLRNIEDLTILTNLETCKDAVCDTLSLDKVKETSNLLLLLLQKSSGLGEDDARIASGYSFLLSPLVSSRIQRISDRSTERIEEYNLDEFIANFGWECPENLRDRLTQTGLPAKRKISLEGPNRRARGENSITEVTAQSSFSRGSVPVTTPSAPTRRDSFRQRKPNTSRPPSMHVDDYVARERNADGTNSSNVIAVQRIGSSSGRPPSIHVDEFMARQRERQSVVGMAVTDAAGQVKTIAAQNNIDVEKSSKPRQLKPDLDDDLQGIDIVFDAEESEPDDKLPFPQPDDNLQQPASVGVGQRSPHSIVEETESDVNQSSPFSRLGTPLASNMDEQAPSEFSSRMSASRPDIPLTREPSISSDKKFPDQPEDSKIFAIRNLSALDSSEIASSSGVAASVYMHSPSSAVQFAVDSRTTPNLYPKANLQQSRTVPLGTGSQGYYDQKFPSNQPPLPPMPPPPAVSPVLSQNMDPVVSAVADLQAHVPPGFHVQSEYGPVVTNSSASPATSLTLPPSKFGRTSHSAPGGSARPPPLPPTPSPYSANASALSSLKNPTSQSPQYFQSVGNSELQKPSVAPIGDGTSVMNVSASRSMLSYPPPSLGQPLAFRPGSMPVNIYGNNLVSHHGDNLPNFSQNLPISIASVHSIPALTQLQPLQPPQIPRPPPQHLRPPVPATSQSEQGMHLLNGSLQMQQSSQVLQPLQVSPAHAYYQTQQQENVPHSSQQQVDRSQRIMQLPGDVTSQQQDPGMSLLEYFRSPEAILSLLNDRDKLCQLLEQYPKLMQMLQERLGRP